MLVYKYLFEFLLLMLLCVYPEVELLDQMLYLGLIFLSNLSTVFHTSCTILCLHQQCTRVSLSSDALEHLFSVLLNNGHNSPGWCGSVD